MSELKPCPFCGCKSIHVFEDQFSGDTPCYIVGCDSCRNGTISTKNRDTAIIAWNRRTSSAEDKLQRVQELLEKVQAYEKLINTSETVNHVVYLSEMFGVIQAIQSIVEEKPRC